MPKRPNPDPVIVVKQWGSTSEIDKAIQRLERRRAELEGLDIAAAMQNHTGAVEGAESNFRESIREVFGQNSPEFVEHKNFQFSLFAAFVTVTSAIEAQRQAVANKEQGRRQAIGILNGLLSLA
ncbi:MAG TPA: hypothetical protein VGG63_18400 [Steroidobacteraceae bacterium]|jgi:hypothetical protein